MLSNLKSMFAVVVGVMLSVLLVGLAEAVEVSVEAESKIFIPDDAIIVPYTLNLQDKPKLLKPEELAVHNVVMIPLDLHFKMTNLIKSADEIRMKFQRPAKTRIVAAAAEYVAEELPQTGSEIVLDGKIYIYQYHDEGTLLPFNIRNSIIESPQLDNQSASISAVSGNRFVLRVSGKGEHVFTFKVRVKIQQEGGWRIAEGNLPTAATSKVQLTLPIEAGDLLTGNSFDVRKWTSGKNTTGTNKKITTTLESNGNFAWRWRSAISEGQVDRSLEVESVVRFDLQDDAAWILWIPKFKISRGKWEILRLQVPQSYTIAEVTGDNVRGWNIVTKNKDDNKSDAKSDETQTIDVELLKPVEKEETLQIRLLKNEPDGKTDKEESWKLSTLSVPEAGIHRGRIDLHRSSVRDFRVTEVKGAALTDQPQTPVTAAASKINTTTPLGSTPFQSYRFIAEPFNLSCTSKLIRKDINVRFNSIMKVTQKRSVLETKIDIRTNDRPFFATVNLPKQFKLKKVTAPSSVFHSAEKRGDENLLYLSHGSNLNGRIVIGIEGDYIPMKLVPPFRYVGDDENGDITVIGDPKYQIDQLPTFSVKFSGVDPTLVYKDSQLELLTEPSLRAEAEKLERCQLVDLLARRHYITSPTEQRELVQLVIINMSADAKANLIFTKTEPEVQCSTITNIKATNESINETILLDFDIRRAGIGEVKFMLPAWMKDAVIEAPFLQRKKIAEREVTRGGEVLKFIEVTLGLQESVMGHLRVLVQADRELRVEKDYRVFVPRIETGKITSQYVVMENDRLSTDEMVVDRATITNLESLDRRMQEWNYLAAMIGENVTEAYCRVMSSKNAVDKETALSFKMKRRDAVRLSDARINKAETRLMYDRNGEYRAEQIYHIDNQKEPYLDVFLPKGASVWDVRFFTAETWQIRDSLQNNPNQIRPEGTPVKPCLMPYNLAATYEPKLAVKFDRVENSPEPVYENGVRIPLIKTDSGDLDYVIRIVYAGASSGLGNFSSMEMPFVKVLNVPVGTSLLKLYLPQSYKYHFSGNLQHINKEQSTTVIQKINESYTQQLGSRLQKTIEEGNLYEQQRAFSNIKNFEILNDANNNAFDDSKMMPQSQLQMPQSQIVQQIQPQNDMNANLAVNDNSGMLRNQFAIQSNSITTQNINRKSIKVENTTPQSSKNNNNVSAGTFIDSWVEDLNDVNEDEDEDVNIANTLSPINNSRESNTKAKALEKSASRVKNSITGDSSKKQNLNTSQRSQAVYEGNLVLGERSQIERQLEVGKMSGDDNSRSSSTGRVRSHSSGLVSPIPESDAKLFNQRPENLLIVNGSETQRDNKGVRASSGSVSPINNDKAVDSSSTSDSIGMTFGSHVENDNSSSKRRVAGANTNAENGSFLEESSFSGNIVAGRDELNKSIGGREERYRNFGSGGFGGNGQLNSLFISGERQAVEVQSLSTRMSGLDIDVPYKGELHIFTTPQGSLDLSFRAMSDKTGSRVVWFFVSLFCLGVIYFAYKGCLIVGKRFRLR